MVDPDAEEAARAQLARIRLSIDNIDAALINLLAERFKFTQEVGRLKAANGMPPSDPEREARQIARLRDLAELSQLDPAFAEKWFNFVVAEVIHHHERLAAESGPSPVEPARSAESKSVWRGFDSRLRRGSTDGV